MQLVHTAKVSNNNTVLVYLPDPDLILPRCEIEFTPMMVTGVGVPPGTLLMPSPTPTPPAGSLISGGCLIGTTAAAAGCGGGGMVVYGDGGSIVGASLNHHDVTIN